MTDVDLLWDGIAMFVDHVMRRSVLRRAARRYLDHDWPIIPGAILTGKRYRCGPLCPTEACHPAVEQWEAAGPLRASDVDRWWSVLPFSVLLLTGSCFDVIEVPAHRGRSATRSGAPGPVAVTPAGRWMFFVRPGDALRPELDAQFDVVLHQRGSWIPAPPTFTPTGPVRWEVHPADVTWTLPDSYAVQRALDSSDRWQTVRDPTRRIRRR